MNHLATILNAADRIVQTESNFEALDESLAFALNPSKVAGVATTDAGPPTGDAHYLGELWVDALFAVWRCSVAGTPGTWVQLTPAVVAAEPGGTVPNGYLIKLTTDWSEEYWDGAVWQVV